MQTPVAAGLDLGNTSTKICINGLVAKIPSRYAYNSPPGQINASGQRGKAQAFSLRFTQKDAADLELWFGQDTLAIPAIQKLDTLKYEPAHIQILFKAALYQWQLTHKSRGADLSKLGRLNIVASMPPGLFEDSKTFARAKKAHSDAFNKVHSHLKIRDGRKTVQVVTHFAGLQPEAVAWGQDIPRKGEWILTVDLGGGTDDYALFNGSVKPRKTKTSNTGLLHVYQQINPADPGLAELEVIRDKKLVRPELTTHYSDVERRIQLFIRQLPVPISRIYIIGGGAALMPPSIQKSIKQLAPSVFIKDEYANARANWHKAGGEK